MSSPSPVRPRLWLLSLLVLAGCAAAMEPARGIHPDGEVLSHPEPGSSGGQAAYFADTVDIAPLRVKFPDWELPEGYMDHVAVRAAQFVSNAMRHRTLAPPVSAWLAEKAFLAAALAADTGGGFGGVPGLSRLPSEPEADAEAAYLAAFTAAVAHYGAGADGVLRDQADRFRAEWLERLRGRPRADPAAIERGVRRGRRAAEAVAAAFPRVTPDSVAMSPAAFRDAIAGELPLPAYAPGQIWQVTPAPDHLERRPFNDYVPVAPGMGLVEPLPKLGHEETSVPPFPSYGSEAWWQGLEAVAKYGGLSSPCRTEGQALTGWFFEASTSGPPTEAGNAVTSVIAYRNLPVAEAARAQFLAWSAMTTAGILTWREKYRHDILRPVTAMNEALREVAAVPEGWRWQTLGPTPPFPAYPSGHAAFTPAAYLTLAMILREHVPDPLSLRVVAASADPESWSPLTNPDGSSRALAFDSISDLISAANESRGYLGIHWEPDGIWGRYLGSLAALRTHQQLLRSPGNPTDTTIPFPGAPPQGADGSGFDPKRHWSGTARAWMEQFPAGLERARGRDPATIVAFPELEGRALPWSNNCATGQGAG